MKYILTLLLLFICTTIFAQQDNNWTTYGGNPGHTGYAPGTIQTLNVQEAWTLTNSSSNSLRAVINEGIVYLLDGTTLKAVKLKDGALIWETPFTAASSFNAPTFSKGNLFFQRQNHNSDSQLFSVNAYTGEVNWQSPFSAQWFSYKSPLVVNGKIYINGGGYGGIYGFDENSGEQLFFKSLAQYDEWTPVYNNGFVYSWVAGTFTKHDPETGETIASLTVPWSWHGYDMEVTAIIDNDIAYFTNTNTLFSVDTNTMAINWQAEGVTKCTPATVNGKVYSLSGAEIKIYDSSTGTLENTITTPETLMKDTIIVTDDKLYTSSSSNTYIFDLSTNFLLETLEGGREITVGLNKLISVESNQVVCYNLSDSVIDPNYAAIGVKDVYPAYEDEDLVIPVDIGLLANDFDVNNDVLSSSILYVPAHGTISLNSNGSFTYTPNLDYSGQDIFYYQVSDGTTTSDPVKVTINILDTDTPYIRVRVYQGTQEIYPGQAVTGVVTGTIDIYNSMHQHAQFYKNFRVLHANETGHMVMTNHFSRTFTLDTSEFYDGENLISVHAHPHNILGQANNTNFNVGSINITTANLNPAPNGDTKLPEIHVDESLFTVSQSTWPFNTAVLNAADNAVIITDDSGTINFDQSSNTAGQAQVISHLGSSVLGRFRWNTRTPPFAEDAIVSGVRLINFQKSDAYNARIIFFIQDEVGRANYGYCNITIPAISDTDRINFPLPALDAHIENVAQGDTIIIPDGEDFNVRVKVTNPGPLTNTFKELTLWVGNRAVKVVNLTAQLNSLNGATEFYVDVPLPASEIAKFEAQREPGQDSTAFAMWVDFTSGTNTNLPSSEHIHLSSIRTLSRPWPFGPATAHVISPEEGFTATGGITVNAASFGSLPEGSLLWISVDGQAPQQLVNKTIDLNNISRGNHSYTLFVGDSQGTPLQNSEASVTRSFTIVNEPPRSNIDTYISVKNTELTTDSTNSVLVNDTDLEVDTLTASLVSTTANGSLNLNSDGTFTYTPDLDFEGSDKFTYQLSDGSDTSNISSVIIKVGSSPSAAQWQQHANGPQHTGYAEGIIENLLVEEAWTISSSQDIHPPILKNNVVYFLGTTNSRTGHLHAVKLNNGEQIWEKAYPYASSYNPPSLYQNTIYFQRQNHNSDSQLYAVNATTGETQWSAPFSAQWGRYKAPTAVNGKIFINGGYYGGVYGFNATDGTQLFFNSGLAQEDEWTPSYYNGYFYTWLRGRLTKHNEDNGSIISELSILSSYDSGVVAIDSGIGFITGENKLFAVDLINMEIIWEAPAYDNIHHTPVVANNMIFVKSPTNTNQILAYNFSGQLINIYNLPETASHYPACANDNKLFVSGTSNTFIFDIVTGILDESIDKAGELVLSNDHLFISDYSFISAYTLNQEAQNLNFPPQTLNDEFSTFEEEALSDKNILANDIDEDPASLYIELVNDVSNGVLSLNPDGSFTYTPNTGFSGTDSFTYKLHDGVNESNISTVSINVIDDASSYIRIKIFKDGQKLKEGEEVSGNITGEIHIHNAMHQHAQFYKNFRTLKANEAGHMIMNNHFIRTFDLDTSEFFDGENLISVHAHPHNVEGQPYNTDFMVGTFKLVTSNSNPAPNGDTELPTAIIRKEGFQLYSTNIPSESYFLSSGEHSFAIFDENQLLKIDQSSNTAESAQAIPHLGGSVLGRFRWSTRTPPFAEDGVISGARLVNFQKSVDHDARIVFFIQDEVGRANYAYVDITIPAISESGRNSSPLPNLDAHFENLKQGDTVIIPDGEDFIVKAKITNPGSLANSFAKLTLWVGNRSVSVVNLADKIDKLLPGETELYVDVPLPSAEINKLQQKRTLGQDSTAFAVWMDFTHGDSNNLPTSEHIHLDSIRTLSRPWQYGPPTAHILFPHDNSDFIGGFNLNASSYGNLPEGDKMWARLDNESPILISGSLGSIDFNNLSRGSHTIQLFITDENDVPLTNPEASVTKNIIIINSAPVANIDIYGTLENTTFNVNTENGILANDADLENDTLTVSALTQPPNGTLTLNTDGSFSYIPDPDFRGIDTFTYKTDDGSDTSAETSVRIYVNAQNSGPIGKSWLTFGQNSQHTNHLPGMIHNLSTSYAWTLPFNTSQTPTQSLIHDGIVYSLKSKYSSTGTLYALSIKTGEVIWEYNFSRASRSSALTYSKGNIFIQRNNGGSDTHLLSIDATDGELNWKVPYNSQFQIMDAPVVEDGVVYIQGGTYGGMYGFDEVSGEQIFFQGLPQEDGWSPTYYEGYVYTFVEGIFTKHDPATGAILNSLEVVSTSYGAKTFAIDQGIAFLHFNYSLYSIDIETMEVLWTQPISTNFKPAVGIGRVYVKSSSNSNNLEVYNYSGELLHTLRCSQIEYTPVITDDKIFVSGGQYTDIFEAYSGNLIETINKGGYPSVADEYLILSGTSEITAYKLTENAASDNHPPIAIKDSLKSYEGETLEFPENSLTSNDFDVDEQPLTISEFSQPQNGSLTLESGLFSYIPDPDFSGYDSFTYIITDGDLLSEETTVSIFVQDTDVPYIKIFVEKGAQAIHEGQEVSGTVTGTIEIYNAMHQHAQFYRNFKVLEMNEQGHMVLGSPFVRTFTIDTSEFYDGENLLSTHVHPHNISGQPNNTDFTFGTFKLLTKNSNPAPNGDTKLPILQIDESKFSVTQTSFPFNSAELNSTDDAVQITDDNGTIGFDQSSSFSNSAQVISHLGSSVLGRFRWTTRTPPFAERSLVDGVRLINFQESTDKDTRIIFFASDAVGRANYGTANITIPAISSSDRSSFPLPGFDAHIENVSQGDTIIIPDGESFNVRVKVTNLGPLKDYFRKVNLWVGNRSVNIIDITDQLNNLGAATEFYIDIPLPASEIVKMQNSRELGPDSTAFALWVDFPNNNNDNLPSSEHVHLNSIRTLSHPWPYGPATAKIISPDELVSIAGGTLSVNATSFGQLPPNSKLMIKVDNGIPEEMTQSGVIFSQIARGTRTITVFIVDENGVPLTNPEASVSQTIEVINEAPKATFDIYTITEAITVPVSEGLLKNDTDAENDPLTAELVITPANGVFSLNTNGSFTYTPANGFSGFDKFKYKVFDGFDYSNESTVIINIQSSVQLQLSESWHMYGNDAAHTHYQPGIVDEIASMERWTQNFASPINRPAVHDGIIYFFSGSTLMAVDIDTSETLWQQTYPGGSFTSPSYANGNLFFQRGNHSSDSQVFSVNATTGVTNWSSPFQTQWSSFKSPTIADGKVFINGGLYGGMYGYDEVTGSQLFFRSLPQEDNWTPNYYNGDIYSWVEGTLIKHDPLTGLTISSLDIVSDYRANVMTADLGIGLVTASGQMYAVDLETMTVLWQVSCYNNTNNVPVTANGFIYIKSTDSRVINCYDFGGNLHKTYTAPTTLSTGSPITVCDNKLFASSNSESYIFDLNSGRIDGKVSQGGTVTPVGKYIIINNGNTLFCYLIDSLYDVTSATTTNGNINIISNRVNHGDYSFINVTADPNYQLSSITVNGVNRPIVLGKTNYSFIVDNVSEDLNIEAQFEPMPLVTVSSGSGDGQYATGSSVTVTADQISGQYFTHWSGDTSGLSNINSANASLLVGSSDLTLTANYEFIQPKPYLEVISNVTDQWKTVNLPESYISPVIVTTPVTTNTSAPIVTRISNVTGNSFDIKVQRADGLISSPGSFIVTYMVVEEGVFNEADHGIKMEAFLHDSQRTDNKSSWVGESVTMANIYAAPVVFGQVMSTNEDQWSTFWTYGNSRTNPVSNGNIHIGKHVAEDSNKSRANETLGCIIIEQGQIELNDKLFNFLLGADTITGVGNGGINYSGLSGDVAVSTLNGLDGGDGGWAVLYGLEKPENGLLKLAVDEDTISDTERAHTNEQLSIATMGPIPVDDLADDFYVTSIDTQLDILIENGVLSNDTTLNPQVEVLSETSNGSLSLNTDGSFSYTPDIGFEGIDQFTYQLVGTNISATAIIAVKSSSGSLRDVYQNLTGMDLSQLRANPVFDNPDITDTMSNFEGPSNWANSYATRLRARVIIPTSGSYTFYVAGDDSSELLYSNIPSGVGTAKIAYINGWTGSRQWTKYSTQKSASINLTAGQIIYLEALSIENAGGDNIAVGWSVNDGDINVITNEYLMLPTENSLVVSDVGSPAFKTLMTENSGSYLISASGKDIWSNADQFGFLNKDALGDIELIAQIESLENTNVWAKAGVMIRESLNANSKHAMTVVTPANGISFQRRTGTGSSSASTKYAGLTAPQWVKILRQGDKFSSYYSSAGSVWFPIGSVNVTMPENVKIGMALTSHNNSTEADALISNFNESKPEDNVSITRFVLVNADTGQDIRELTHNATIKLSTDGTNLSIRAEGTGITESVTFSIDGADAITEDIAPFALKGKTGSDYTAWSPQAGSYTILATPYSEDGAQGSAGSSLAIVVNVTQ